MDSSTNEKNRVDENLEQKFHKMEKKLRYQRWESFFLGTVFMGVMFFSVSNPDWIKKAWAAATYMITDRPILTVTNTSDPTFRAVNQSSGQALRGSSTSGEGIFGYSRDNSGIYGESKGTSINAAGVFGKGNSTYGGVFSTSSSQRGQVRLLSESLYSPELNDTCRAGELRARYDAKDVWLMFCSRNCNNSLGVNKTCQWEYIAVSGTQLPRAP